MATPIQINQYFGKKKRHEKVGAMTFLMVLGDLFVLVDALSVANVFPLSNTLTIVYNIGISATTENCISTTLDIKRKPANS